MSLSIAGSFIRLVTNGHTGAGAFSVSGVKTGDILLTVVRNSGGSLGDTEPHIFKGLVTNDDELTQKLTSNLSSVEFAIIIFRSDV